MNGKNSQQSTVNSQQSTENGKRVTENGWRRLLVPVTVLALSLVALQAILRPSLPCSDDAAFHLLRLTQLDYLLRQGVVYSRWAPDMAQGYGFPFFNFYAPLSYYLAEGVSLLAGNLNLGLRITFALGIYLAGLCAYRLSRDHFSRPAALVTAVAYMYAPYFAYDTLFRGNLAESMAWLFLPLSLWTIGRLARTGQNRWLVAAALSYAAVLLTHNVFALIFSPLLALYGFVESCPLPGPLPKGEGASSLFLWERVRERVPPVLLALLLGLGLTAFFWLPAMMERSLVHSDRLLVPPIFVYWGNFVTLAEIFTPPQTVYDNLINPSPARALGLLPLLLALPALVAGWWRFHNGRRRQVIFFGAATAVYVFLMTAVAEPVWANLPLIEYVQFPWRLLGPAALCLAILVGASIDVLTSGRVARWQSGKVGTGIAVVYCAALILGNRYWLDARYCPGLADPTIADMQEFERATLTIGTTAKGEYLPLTVEYMPEEPAVTPFEILPETAVEPVETTTSTSSVPVLLSTSRTPKQFTAAISASEPFTLTANTFAYPGWQAELNGQKVDITPSEGTGLITVPIPTGEYTLTITFRETPLRLLANAISLLSLGVLLLVAGGWWQVAKWQSSKVAEGQDSNLAALVTLTIVGLVVFALVVWLLPKLETPLRRSTIPAAEASVVYQNNLTLLNYTIAAREMAADDSLLVQSSWQAPQPVAGDFRETVRLIGPDGLLWSPKTAVSPRWYREPTPTYAWTPAQFADSQLLIEPIPGTPPGLYTIQLLLFDEETLAPVPLADGQTTVDLGTVQVTRPQLPTVLEPQYSLNQVWDGVSLSGVSLDRETAVPGDPFLLTLYWQVNETPADDASVQLSLIDEAGTVVFNKELPTVRADFPTSQWQAGDAWLGQHAFRLPVALDSGEYQWTLQWCVSGECAGETALTEPAEVAVSTGSTAVLGNLAITAPERLFTPPTLDIETTAQFSDLITLLGVNTTVQPENLQTTLVWQAVAEMPISYRVFVHLVDENGQIVAQSDGEPAGWARPTTGWLPDEIIFDTHTLSLENVPAGSYQLNIGLYDPETGERLTLANGETAVTIPEVTLP